MIIINYLWGWLSVIKASVKAFNYLMPISLPEYKFCDSQGHTMCLWRGSWHGGKRGRERRKQKRRKEGNKRNWIDCRYYKAILNSLLPPWDAETELTFPHNVLYSLFNCHLYFLVAHSCPTLLESASAVTPCLPRCHQNSFLYSCQWPPNCQTL